MRKLGKIIAVAGVAAKGAPKAAVVVRTLEKDLKTLHKVLLTGILVYETIRPKSRKSQKSKNTMGLPAPAKK